MTNTTFGSRQLRKLVDHLWNDEAVESIAKGQYGTGFGLLVVTNRRVLFVHDGMMSKTTEDFPLEKISSIQWSSGLVQGSVVIYVGGAKAQIKNVANRDGKALVELVRHKIATLVESTGEPPRVEVRWPASDRNAVLEQLRQLGELRSAGVLTEQEFETQKANLLRQM
jgi:hypothetical protein